MAVGLHFRNRSKLLHVNHQPAFSMINVLAGMMIVIKHDLDYLFNIWTLNSWHVILLYLLYRKCERTRGPYSSAVA